MTAYKVTVIAADYRPDRHDLTAIHCKAECSDAAISFQKGVAILEFNREATSFLATVLSALDSVLRSGAEVKRLEPDHLVSQFDIARRAGLSRGALTNYQNGSRGKDFPIPVARVTSGSSLWDWSEVANWLYRRERIGREAVVQARIVKEVNSLLESVGSGQDRIRERLVERLGDLEAAYSSLDADIKWIALYGDPRST